MRGWRTPKGTPWTVYTPVITWTVIVAYLALALGMTFQPSRFSNTPSYGELLQVASAPTWGFGYFTVAVLLAAWRVSRSRTVGVLAHTAGVILTGWWLAAFVHRYLTDSGTTLVNVVSWSVFFSLVIRSISGIDEEPHP